MGFYIWLKFINLRGCLLVNFTHFLAADGDEWMMIMGRFSINEETSDFSRGRQVKVESLEEKKRRYDLGLFTMSFRTLYMNVIRRYMTKCGSRERVSCLIKIIYHTDVSMGCDFCLDG